MNSFLKLIRFQNLLIIVFTQLSVRMFLTFGKLNWAKVTEPPIWVIVFSTVLVAAAGYIINDYYDVKIDAVNRPQDVLLGRKLKRRPLLLMHSGLNLLAILLSLLLRDWLLTLLIFASANLLWLYSNHLKRKPLIGNITIALLSGLTVFLPGIYYKAHEPLLWMYTVLAFAISIVREILKDMEDIKGDKQFGCQTMPIVYGIRKTKTVILGILAAFLVLLLYFWIQVVNESWYLLSIVAPFSFAIGYLVYQADKKADYKRLSLVCKIYMVIGVCSMFLI